MTIKVPPMFEMLSKARGKPIRTTKRHRPKKGGGYHRARTKQDLKDL